MGMGANIWRTYFLYEDTYIDAKGKMKPMNLARLYEEGVIETPEVFYCSAVSYVSQVSNGSTNYTYATEQWSYDYYIQGVDHWGIIPPAEKSSANSTGSTYKIRSAYNYLRYWKERIKRIEKLGEYPVVTDQLYDKFAGMHKDMNGDPKGWNAAWGDGHVRFVNATPSMMEDDLWLKGTFQYRWELLFRWMGKGEMDPETKERYAGW